MIVRGEPHARRFLLVLIEFAPKKQRTLVVRPNSIRCRSGGSAAMYVLLRAPKTGRTETTIEEQAVYERMKERELGL